MQAGQGQGSMIAFVGSGLQATAAMQGGAGRESPCPDHPAQPLDLEGPSPSLLVVPSPSWWVVTLPSQSEDPTTARLECHLHPGLLEEQIAHPVLSIS